MFMEAGIYYLDDMKLYKGLLHQLKDEKYDSSNGVRVYNIMDSSVIFEEVGRNNKGVSSGLDIIVLSDNRSKLESALFFIKGRVKQVAKNFDRKDYILPKT